jgi:uncharacterized membrane protein HdeD (DUF308 family)
MRYLLIVVGLLGVLLGFWVIATGPTNASPPGSLFVQVGAVFLAVGLATVDIVEAIKAKRQ